MSTNSIGGKKREVKEFDNSKKVGLFEARVVAINPTAQEYKEELGIDLKEDSKATEYLGESKDGNTTLRIDVWLEEVKNNDKFKVTFFLEDKKKENKDGTKSQFINNIGGCSWADDENNLPDWFKTRDYRQAYVGEEELYKFLRTWLGSIDYKDAESVLQIEWKKLMKGNVSDLKDQIDGEYCTNVIALATVKTVEKDGDVKSYQSVYNRDFLPAYCLKAFRLVDYDNEEILTPIRAKKPKDQKIHEKFAITLHGEYGCKDFFKLKDLQEYNENENIVSQDNVITDDSPMF